MDAWPTQDFDRRLATAGRVVILFGGGWCPDSRIFLPAFQEADSESPLRFARADLARSHDARWEGYRIERTPTVIYFEHGEELERVEALPHAGLDRDRFEAFLQTVHDVQDGPVSERMLSRARSKQQREARAAGPKRRAK